MTHASFSLKSFLFFSGVSASYLACYLHGKDLSVFGCAGITLVVVGYVIAFGSPRFQSAFIQMHLCTCVLIVLASALRVPYISDLLRFSIVPPTTPPWLGIPKDGVKNSNDRHACVIFIVLVLLPFVTAFVAEFAYSRNKFTTKND